MTRGQGLNSKPEFSTVVCHGGNLGSRSRQFSPLRFFFTGDVSLRTGPPPPLEWLRFLPLVTARFITPRGADSPGSGRIVGVIGA